MESYLISVTLADCCRHIQISADATLYRFHQAILNAVDFEDDHSHEFHFDNKLRNSRDVYVSHRDEPADRSTKQFTLRDLKLRKGKRFLYLFDCRDWRFQCQVLQSLEERVEVPVAIWGSGDAPEQYESDWEWDIEMEREISYPRLLTETRSFVPEDTSVYPKRDYPGFPRLRTKLETLNAFDRLGISYDQQMEIEDYFRAAARLYGIVPLRKMLEIYNRYNSPLTEELFLQAAEILRHDFQMYSILNCEASLLKNHAPMESMLDWEIVAAYLYEDESGYFDSFVQAQGEIPFKRFSKKEFLAYSDYHYLPKKGYVKVLREYLTEKLESQSAAENYLRCMFDLTMQDVIMEDILDICAEWGYYPDTPKERRRFETVYLEMERHIPKAIYRGHSEAEMEKMMHRESEEPYHECGE